jgi:chlorite dismutase
MTVYPAGMFPATFIGGAGGIWTIDRMTAVAGEPLPVADRLEIRKGIVTVSGGVWRLAGVAGHTRYAERAEKTQLDALSPTLGRPEATRAALIPIRKSAGWWTLPQDERRAIFEERSRHIADSLPFAPRIARRLYHARDLGQPFDFLTWFEFAPEDERAFDDLVAMLRAREEWSYVDREVDLRLSR